MCMAYVLCAYVADPYVAIYEITILVINTALRRLGIDPKSFWGE